MRGTLARPSSRSTTRCSRTSTSVGTSSTANRPARSGRSSTSTRVTRRRSRSFLARCARSAVHPPGGPERLDVKKTRSGAGSVGACRHRGVVFPPRPASKRRHRSTLTPWASGTGSVSPLGLGVALGVLAAAIVGVGGSACLRRSCSGRRPGWAPVCCSAEWGDAVAGAAGGVLGGAAAGVVVRGALGRGGTRGATGLLVGVGRLIGAALAFVPVVGYLVALLAAVLARRAAAQRGALRGAPQPCPLSAAKPLVLVVIDGLTPSMLERAVDVATPALAALADAGRYRRAISTFPSLTPVCLSSIATGAHPDVHGIPHLVWYHRGERRLVEYGSSFGGPPRRRVAARDPRRDLQHERASTSVAEAVTVFEALEDAGLHDGCGQHDVLPRAHAAPAARSGARPRRPRAEAVLLLQPLRVGPDGRADRRAQPRGRLGRRLRGRRRALARDA